MDELRVDPAALRRAGDGLVRLADLVRGHHTGADVQVTAALARLGEFGAQVRPHWVDTGRALDRLEQDCRELGRGLAELASYFTDLDARTVPR